MKKKIWFIVLIILVVSIAVSVNAQTTSKLTDDGTTTKYVSYTGSSSGVSQYYQDLAPNSDVGIQLCGQGSNKYVQGVYGANVSGTMTYVPITYGSHKDYSLAPAPYSAGGCYWTRAGFLTISPSHLTTKTPEVFIAAFPGYLWTLFSTNQDGSSPNFVFMNTGSWLRGSYSVSGTFSQTTKNITFSTPTIVFRDTGGSTFSKSATDSTFGVNSDRRMVAAVCADTYGQNCYDATIINSTAQFSSGLELFSGIPSPSDSTTYTRYLVLNGIGTSKCIGPQSQVDSISLNPPSGSQGTIVNISATISNQGDVDINNTHSFNVSFWKTSPGGTVHIGDKTITGLTTSQTKTVSVTYDTSGLTSGPTFQANLSDSTFNVGSCGGTKSRQSTFSWVTYVTPFVYIDGVQTDNFTCAARPQNVTIHLNDSNDNTLPNTWIYLHEVNGISPFAATQVYSAAGGQRYVRTVNRGDIQTDANGTAQFTVIPTGNKLLGDPSYAYLNLSSIVGSYQLYFTTSSSNQILQNSVASSQYNLSLNSLTPCSPNATQQYSLTVPNQDSYVKTVLNFVYQTFATARRWIS